jgi:MSHA biogenesis protein MshN
LLTELYIHQDNAEAANIILDQANYFAVDTKTKLKAQVLSLQGDNEQAISLLEKNLAAADVNESYRSLLASLYHKTANYPQSILSYQRLINSFGEKPAYWLGLALAYDGLSQPKNALQAYLRLREFPQLQDQVKHYTDQRIAALRSQ